jgi:CspA family cold shock protein
MSDGDDWRRARRSRRGRGGGAGSDFPGDDGGWSPPPSIEAPAQSRPGQSFAPASGPELGAEVKRFDAERGFGFAALDGGGGDAFLHISVLQRAGAQAVSPGARLRVRVGQGQKGPQITEVLEIGEAAQAPPRASASEGAGGLSSGAEEVRGTVKWYSAEKGFGFVTPQDGGRDVFVHATALERSGLPPLTEGQRVMLRVVQGRKGPEAETVSTA